MKLPRLRIYSTIDSHSFSLSFFQIPAFRHGILISFILPPPPILVFTSHSFALAMLSPYLVSSKLDGPAKFAVRHFHCTSNPVPRLSFIPRETLLLFLCDRASHGEKARQRAKFRALARKVTTRTKTTTTTSFPNDRGTVLGHNL